MKNLIYITNDTWWDTDISMFPQLSEKFNIDVFVNTSTVYYIKYPKKESNYVKSITEYVTNYRNRNIKKIFDSTSYFIKFFKKYKNVKGIIFYVFCSDPYFNLLFLLFTPPHKVIISIHDFEEHEGTSLMAKLFKSIFYKRYNFFNFYDQNQSEKFHFCYSKKKIFSIEMPLKDFGKPKGLIKIKKKGKRIFLFFGLIEDYKRLDIFIKAANIIDEKAHFVIAGKCNSWNKYEKLMKNKLNFSCFIEFIENEKIPDFFSQADFLVLPYSDVSQSGPLLIAYNYNVPIIASDNEFFSNMIIDGYSGFIFKNNNMNELYNIMNSLSDISDNEYNELKTNQMKQVKIYKEKTKIANIMNNFIENNRIQLR